MPAAAPATYTDLLQLLRDLPIAVREKRRRTGQSVRSAATDIGIGAGTLHRVEDGTDVVLSAAVLVVQWLAR